ncbi:hypothetical protein HK104_002060 [Borealophlyctis nickersoniae]|nr:hypothetical protein HK104_002060 [Borealophlyctis nickersoniae]
MNFINNSQGNHTTAGSTIKSDFNSSTIRSLLEFLYTGFIITHHPKTFDERCDLIRLADMYQLPPLHVLVAEWIVTKDLTYKTARQLLEFAHRHGGCPGCGTLRDFCMGVVRSNLKTYSLEQGFGTWPRDIDRDLAELLYENAGADPPAQEEGEESAVPETGEYDSHGPGGVPGAILSKACPTFMGAKTWVDSVNEEEDEEEWLQVCWESDVAVSR